MNNYTHTDLALELQEELQGKLQKESQKAQQEESQKSQQKNSQEGQQENLQEDRKASGKIRGISVQKKKSADGRILETKITVENDEGAELIGKPPGIYITLESEDLAENDGSFHENMAASLARQLAALLAGKKNLLIAGLGNTQVTPDSLGPLVAENLFLTRHLREMNESNNISNNINMSAVRQAAAIAPGVMAQTGMETGEILCGILRQIRPEALIVIDALAAKSTQRLNRTIQICNTGIAPGSGVGNHRHEITQKTMGVPVIAIGVPTVISMPSLACDIMESFCAAADGEEAARFAAWPEGERYRFMTKILDERLWGLFVTPKEIDESVKRISYTLSEGLNRFIAGNLPAGACQTRRHHDK